MENVHMSFFHRGGITRYTIMLLAHWLRSLTSLARFAPFAHSLRSLRLLPLFAHSLRLLRSLRQLYPRGRQFYPRERQLYPRERQLYPRGRQLYAPLCIPGGPQGASGRRKWKTWKSEKTLIFLGVFTPPQPMLRNTHETL